MLRRTRDVELTGGKGGGLVLGGRDRHGWQLPGSKSELSVGEDVTTLGTAAEGDFHVPESTGWLGLYCILSL